MLLEWWNSIVRWIGSDDGWTIITGAILPFVAILAAGLFAGLIVRGSLRRFIALQNRQAKAAAVASLISAGRRAASWSSLTAQEKAHVETLTSEAEVRVHLLPEPGSSLAAEWSAHHIASMKRNSAAYVMQAEQDLRDLQDGLIAWQEKPSRARRLFAADLAAWRYEAGGPEEELMRKQREWASQQASTSSDAQTFPLQTTA
jgi:hypothetical protein